MSDYPKFSVVTITFRDLPGLTRTIESVRAQQYVGDIEHIVIDGGSGADVVQYLSACEPGFSYWQSEPDGGRYDAMNKGIAQSTGDLIWFMHSGDCFSDPGAIAAVARLVQGHGNPRKLWGYGQVNRIGTDGRILGRWGLVPFSMSKFAIGAEAIPHQGAFFGSDFIRDIGNYNVVFGDAADQLLMLVAALRSQPLTLARVVCDFDTTGVGSVRSIRENFHDMRRAWKDLDYYPLGSPRKSLSYLRYREYRARSVYAVLTGLNRVSSRISSRSSP